MALGGAPPQPHGDRKRQKSPRGFRTHDGPLVNGQRATLSFALSLFSPLFSYPGHRDHPQRPEFSFLFPKHDHPSHQPFVLAFFYISLTTPHQTRRRVRWLRPPRLRPRLRVYLKRLHSDSYLRYRRRTRRFRRSRGLYLCYPLQSYQSFQTWGTDSLLLWPPPSRLVPVRRTQTPTTTRTTRTRTTCVMYGCGRQHSSVLFLTLLS